MLKIKNLYCKTSDGLAILNGVSLNIKPGELHVLMGPNGSGKSTLAKTLMGHPNYKIEQGSIILDGEDITGDEPNEKAIKGLYTAFQYPTEVPGVNFSNFLRMAYNQRRPEDKSVPVFKFRKILKEKADELNFSDDLLDRNLNEDLSGGEKKKSEILQMSVLEPKYAILDETDSGLDLDALKDVFEGISKLFKKQKKLGILLVTHYQRVFDYINPDCIHIMVDGKIVKSGDKSLLSEISKKGYKQYK